MSKFIRVCEVILLCLFVILMPFFTNKIASLLVIPLFILLFYISQKIPSKRYVVFLFVIALLMRIGSLFLLKVNIVDDFLTMLKASRKLISGDLSFLQSEYFLSFSYQLGHVLYQALLLKIVNSVLFLKIINSIITSFSVVLLYLIVKKIVNEDIARGVSFLYLFFFYPLYLNSVLTNQLLPALLCLGAIYYYISHEFSWKNTIIIAVLFAFANFFRTESIIWIFSIVLYQLFVSNEKFKNRLIQSIILLGCYLIINTIISSFVFMSPIHSRLNNQYPGWKFYCGLSVEHNGFYNVDDQNRYFASLEKNELLKNRIHDDYLKFPVLFLKKEVIIWTQTNYDLSIDGNISKLFLKVNQGFVNVILLLFIIGLIPYKKETKKELILLKIILAVYYGVYLFIEISPRYAYIMYFLIFIITGCGIERLIKLFKERVKN